MLKTLNRLLCGWKEVIGLRHYLAHSASDNTLPTELDSPNVQALRFYDMILSFFGEIGSIELVGYRTTELAFKLMYIYRVIFFYIYRII